MGEDAVTLDDVKSRVGTLLFRKYDPAVGGLILVTSEGYDEEFRYEALSALMIMSLFGLRDRVSRVWLNRHDRVLVR